MCTPRTSAKLEGVGYGVNHRTPPFKRGIHLVQRWFHGALLLPAEQGFSQALPLRFLPSFTETSKRQVSEACREWEAAHQFLRDIRQHLLAWGRAQQAVLFVADGSCDTVGFWQGLPQGIHALVRSAKNRAFRRLPPAERHGNRKYGDPAPSPEKLWQERTGWSWCKLELRGRERRLRYLVEGPFLRQNAPHTPLFLLIIGGEHYTRHGKVKQREPVPYLINAKRVDDKWELPFPEETLLFWVWQRWELEVTHRELKSNFGLGEKQAWHPRAAISTVQWSAWVYALFILAGYRIWGLTQHPRAQTAWWSGGQRWSFNTLMCTVLRSAVDILFKPVGLLSRTTCPKKSQIGSIYATRCMGQPVYSPCGLVFSRFFILFHISTNSQTSVGTTCRALLRMRAMGTWATFAPIHPKLNTPSPYNGWG
jgi:hypothetical protein